MSNIACEQLESLLSAYRDGELTEAEHGEAQGHILKCPACQQKLTELDAVVQTLKSLPRYEPQRDYAANIEQLIASQTPTKASSSKRPIVWGGLGIAAAAVVMIAVGTIKPSANLSSLTASMNGTLHAGDSATDSASKVGSSIGAQQSWKNSARNQNTDNEVASIKDSDFVALHGDEATNEVLNAKEHHAATSGAGMKENGHNSNQTKEEVDPNRKKNSKFNPRLQIAENKNVGTDNLPAIVSKSQSRLDSDSIRVADNPVTKTTLPDSNLVAVYETDQKGVTEELGITTDEDGLYALKL